MLTLSSIEPEMNGFGRYHAVTRELFHAKTAYFRQLNARKRVPFHPGGNTTCLTTCMHVSGLDRVHVGLEVHTMLTRIGYTDIVGRQCVCLVRVLQ